MRIRSNTRWCLLALAAVLLLMASPARAQQANSCLDCHSLLPEPLGVTEETFQQDVHARQGLNCAGCHGGDPTVDDDRAMSKAAGFRGKPKREDIPAFCARCHSDGEFMRQYNPSLRTDQLAQYKTSVHGKRLAQGDTKVAVCTDCHSVHNIRPARDSRSTVHPLNVATTCAHCHADSEYMKPYRIPTDQFASYRASVHYKAMTERGDLSAPTCSTCHGNHGAAPPGVQSVEQVCANCHVFQAQLFEKSPHAGAFALMDLPGCVTCHSNHRIEPPSDKMIGTGPDAVCTNCHAEGDAGFIAAAAMRKQLETLDDAIQRSDRILDQAARSGMEVSEPELEQSQARDALTRARVTIHSFSLEQVKGDIQKGLDVAEKTYQAGVAALKERDFRRFGLALSVVAILLVLIGLRLYIREIEARNGAEQPSKQT